MRSPSFATWVNRLRRSPEDDFVKITGEPSWFAQSFRMSACRERDQVATLAGRGWAEFEKPMPKYFAQAVRDAAGGIILDVGANTGFYSLLAYCVSSSVRVTAYEPMASVRKILCRNLSLNGARRRVSVSPFAASNKNGHVSLFIPDASHGLIETSASLSSAFKTRIGTEERVTAATLDSRHLNGARVAIIKIDAESHDIEVLRGAEKLMLRDRPVVFVEVLLGADEQGLTDILKRCGYRDIVLFPEGASEPNDAVRHETRAWNHMWMPGQA